MRIEFWKYDDLWFARIVGRNGRVMFETSKGQRRRAQLLESIESLRRSAARAKVLEVIK